MIEDTVKKSIQKRSNLHFLERRSSMSKINSQSICSFSTISTQVSNFYVILIGEYFELHSNPYTKAWGVLYNFRNKSLESPLYDEVDNIQSRNCKNKRISHRLFNTFYENLLDVALKRNYYIEFKPVCQNSGWAVDVSIMKGKHEQDKIGFVFLLKEDLCYNISSGKYEPLGLQKLMIKQLESVSLMKVVPIFESYYQNEIDQHDFLDRLISKNFMQMQAK
jgi:hypothetical protein